MTKPKAWLSEEEDRLTPERSLWQDPNEPISHYYRWIWEYLAYLPLLCDVERHSSILEIGCSHGRTSRGLLQYLRSPGRYFGFDVDREQIDEAVRRITAIAPNFRYSHVDIYNRHYNPGGSIPASEFAFPHDGSTFDCVYAASVFTHLLPDEVTNYLRQTARVLKPGGKALFSFFVLDFYQGPGSTIAADYQFDHLFEGNEGVAVKDREYPDTVIAYSRETIAGYAAAAGLELARIVPGLWSNGSGLAVNEQDLVLLQAR
ncbi:MAG: class I SAM-dependent methyltransferase [bacterium]|nr:class I SAM-dependent methyltransferase [bacterium]